MKLKNPELDTCARCGCNSAREMHPDDIANQRASEREAAANIDEFFRRHLTQFKALVQTYGDGRAEMLLEELRELFWTATPVGSEQTKEAP